MSFRTECWSCGSRSYQETVSREFCPDCGIECDYHGSGMNDRYRAAMDAKHRWEDLQREWQDDEDRAGW